MTAAVDGRARTLARAFLAQQLAGEGDALMLERGTRAEVLAALAAERRAAGRLAASRPGRAVGHAQGGRGGRQRSVVGNAPGAGSGRSRSAIARPRVAGSAASDAAVAVSDAAISAAPDLAALEALVAACTRCGLHASRTRPVFGEGASDARVVCVGEAPGAREDQTGRPFVGRAGGLLDRLLMAIGLPRASVYICNVLKSRPPRNRDPRPEEVEACSPFLLRQLDFIKPDVIIAFGAFAARTLLNERGALGRMRGRVHRYVGYPVVVTYHPAALLRNPNWVRRSWEDLQIARRILDGDSDG